MQAPGPLHGAPRFAQLTLALSWQVTPVGQSDEVVQDSVQNSFPWLSVQQSWPVAVQGVKSLQPSFDAPIKGEQT